MPERKRINQAQFSPSPSAAAVTGIADLLPPKVPTTGGTFGQFDISKISGFIDQLGEDQALNLAKQVKPLIPGLLRNFDPDGQLGLAGLAEQLMRAAGLVGGQPGG